MNKINPFPAITWLNQSVTWEPCARHPMLISKTGAEKSTVVRDLINCKNVLCNLHVLYFRELIVRTYCIIQKLRVFYRVQWEGQKMRTTSTVGKCFRDCKNVRVPTVCYNSRMYTVFIPINAAAFILFKPVVGGGVYWRAVFNYS